MLNLAHKYSQVLKRSSTILLWELERFVNGALMQIGRVERASRTMDVNARKEHKNRRAHMARLFLDAHFYFVCIGQVEKFLGQLCGNLQ
jgi:hypothetical protein